MFSVGTLIVTATGVIDVCLAGFANVDLVVSRVCMATMVTFNPKWNINKVNIYKNKESFSWFRNSFLSNDADYIYIHIV